MSRLQGLATLVTVSSRESRAGFISRRQRSWDSPFGAFSSQRVSTASPQRKNPHTVFPSGCCAPQGSARTGRPRSLGFDPAENPLPMSMCLAHSPAGCSLGIRLFQGSRPKPSPGVCPTILSRAFGRCLATAATRLRVSQPRLSRNQLATSARRSQRPS
jgi:hypothetical protein